MKFKFAILAVCSSVLVGCAGVSEIDPYLSGRYNVESGDAGGTVGARIVLRDKTTGQTVPATLVTPATPTSPATVVIPATSAVPGTVIKVPVTPPSASRAILQGLVRMAATPPTIIPLEQQLFPR